MCPQAPPMYTNEEVRCEEGVCMIEVVCPGCGNVLQVEERYAGHSGRCNLCNAQLRVPMPEHAAAGSQFVAPESFGHYSKAKEERWEDPLDKVEGNLDLGAIPAEILERHKAFEAKRRRRTLTWVGLAVISAIALLGTLLYVLLRPGTSPGKPAPADDAVAVEAPASAPPPAADSEPAAPAAVPAEETVYAVESDWRYHHATCQVYVSGVGAKHSGTVAQAVAAGYQRCEYCNPPLATVGSSPFLAPPKPRTNEPSP